MSHLDPVPTSISALLDGVQAGDLANRNPRMWGDASFGSTLDGAMFFFGNPPSRRRAEATRGLLGVRWGRHNPWCASWADAGCPPTFRGVYELVATGVVEQQISTGPLSGTDALLLQTEVGLRSADTALSPVPLARAAVAYSLPRAFGVWFDTSIDGAIEAGVPEEAAPPEFRGSLIGLWGHADLAFRAAPWFTLSTDLGAASGLGGDTPTRGLHPDADFDLVLFSQVVADGTANRDSTLVPTLGGVTNAVFGRLGGTVRIGTRSGFELPVFVTRAWALADVPGVMASDGALGSEVDVGARLDSGDWRAGFEVGMLFPGAGLDPLRAAPDPVLADDLPVVWELRIGRNL